LNSHEPGLAPAARSALDILRSGARFADWPRAEAELRAAGPVVWRELAEIVVVGPAESAERAGVLFDDTAATETIRESVAAFVDERTVYRVSAGPPYGVEGDAAAPYARVMAVQLGDPSPGAPSRPRATVHSVAERATVTLGSYTLVRGSGVLALTACGRQGGHRGAFPL